MIQLNTPLQLDRTEARVALAILEAVIDALIDLHTRMARLYELHPNDDGHLPF